MSIERQIAVRFARPEDVSSLRDFNIAMARETERKELTPTVVESGVRNLLERPEYGFYLLAECDGSPVGSLMVTMEWSDWRDGLFWWIQSVYVVPSYRRGGVFRSLYQRARGLAQADSLVCGLRLYVERENEVAQQTYTMLGMHRTSYRFFEEEFQE